MMHQPGAFGKRFRCACCKNPWNLGDESASNEVKLNPCFTESKGFTGIDISNFDPTVEPSENFYLWSNGGWMKDNPIPGEYSSWNTFIVLRDLNLDRLKVILSELSNQPDVSPKDNESKLSAFYEGFMDEGRIASVGLEPLVPLLDLVTSEALQDPTLVIATLHAQYGVKSLFKIYSSPDKKESTHSIGALYQGGLGLPDRDYYFDEDKSDKRIKYVEYIEALFTLLGKAGIKPYDDVDMCKVAAGEVFAFETKIASSHLTRTESRDPEKTYNKMSIDALKQLTTPEISWGEYLSRGVDGDLGFDWHRYFSLIGKPAEELGEINVAMVDAMKAVRKLLFSKSSAAALPHYLSFHIADTFAPNLLPEFTAAHFSMHEKTLKGTQEERPRWKRALEQLESALGDALGELYVQKHFAGEAKSRALAVVEQVRDALRQRLGEVKWMSDATRTEALKKMEKFAVKIGYPDKWTDFSTLQVLPNQHLKNVFAANEFWFKDELKRMNSPTDRSKWFMTPQTVNAYYHPSLNEIVFPAAILQAPFFDPNADDAVNFGSLGAVVGHEMTHGFDDQGRKYDSAGNMRDWWAAGDGVEYERRAAVMVNQAAQFTVHGIALNGKLTCGENIADLGGLKLALRALRTHLNSNGDAAAAASTINGFTQEQRFFLAWSQAWRGNITEERAKQLVTIDPHGPNELRCNGTLSNIDEFLIAFNIQPGDKMYRPVEERVDIW